MALDPEVVDAHMRAHFANLTTEQFILNVRKRNPDLAQELWGDLSVAEILARRAVAEAAVASASPQPRLVPRRRGVAGAFARFRRSVLRLFS